MKKYWFKSHGFANSYDIVWTDNSLDAKDAEDWGYERISRKDMERMCANERYRRKVDQSCSGYAPAEVYPIWFADAYREGAIRNVDHTSGYIVEPEEIEWFSDALLERIGYKKPKGVRAW